MGELEHIKILQECRDIKSPKELDKYDWGQVDNLYAIQAGIQRELVFHDTVPIEDEQLGEARSVAKNQKYAVLDIFRTFYPMNLTPPEVFEEIKSRGKCALLTSIRRAITDLTKEGRIIKCQWSESRDGQFGMLNRTWKYVPDWNAPLNPKK